MNTKREISTHAAAARAIRTELKNRGIHASVTSRSFSMGNSVDVTIYDELPATVRKIQEFAQQFQYGHFDGMIDMYEYSNKRDDIPQAKFVHVTCRYSDELKQAIWDHVRSYYAGYEDAPKAYKDAANFMVQGVYADEHVWRICNGSDQLADKFWVTRKARVAA